MITKATFKHFFRSLTLVLLFAVTAQTVNAQGFLAQKDLSQFKVEMLSEADISKIKDRLQSSGLSMDQIKTQTSAKGLPAAEFEKLRTRLSATNNATNTIGTKIESVQSNREGNATSNASSFKEAEVAANSLVFGSELFQNTGSLTLELRPHFERLHFLHNLLLVQSQILEFRIIPVVVSRFWDIKYLERFLKN